MNDTIPLTMRRLTPEEVLACLRDMVRGNLGDEWRTMPDGFVNAEMKVRDFRYAIEFVGELPFYDPPLGPLLNEYFGTNFSDEEWRAVLRPEKKRTLRDVSDLIATRAVVPLIQPLTLFNQPCLSAGVFLTVRTLLADAGADVSQISPSAPLEPYLRGWPEVFQTDIRKLVPGTVPPLFAVCSYAKLIGVLIIVGFVGSVASWMGTHLGNVFYLPLVASIGLLLIVHAVWLGLIIFKPTSFRDSPIEFGELKTFRDLVDTMLRRPLRPRTPVPQP